MLYFIRHGESVANLEKTFAGSRVDSPLTEKGCEQAGQAAQKIIESGISFDRIISSPLVRASKTAEIIAHEIGFSSDIEIDDRIREYDMGSLSGKRYPPIEDSHILTSSFDAEKPELFRKRINSFVLNYENKKDVVLIIAHDFVHKMMKVIRDDMDENLFCDIADSKNGELLKIF